MPKKKNSPFSLKSLSNTPMKPHVKARLQMAALACGPIAMLGVVGLYAGGATDDPPDPMVLDNITYYERVNDWAGDFMGLWLAGSEDNQDALDSMTASTVEAELPPTGYSVNEVRTYVLDSEPGEDGQSAHPIEARVQATAPGGQGVEWLTYHFTMISLGDTFQAPAMPHPVNTTRLPYDLEIGYPETANIDSPLGQSVSNFAAAYMTPSDSSSSLASTVTADFDGAPVAQSLWEQIEVEDILFAGSSDVDQASEGDEINALVTVKAMTSGSSWSKVSLPLVMQMQSNGQWSVAGFDSTVRIGGIDTSQSGSEETVPGDETPASGEPSQDEQPPQGE